MSSSGIIPRFRDAIEQGAESVLRKLPQIQMEDIYQAARRGDRLAVSFIKTQIEDLCIGLNNYIYLYAPQRIILGGGIALGLQPYWQQLENGIFALPYPWYTCDLVPAVLGDLSGIVGGAVIVRQSLPKG